MNIRSRVDDREISRFTPHTEVKKILEERFLRRKENRTGGEYVVHGEQCQETTAGSAGVQVLPVEGTVTAHGRTPSRPRGRKLDVGDNHPAVDSPSPGFVDTSGETQWLESEKKRSA